MLPAHACICCSIFCRQQGDVYMLHTRCNSYRPPWAWESCRQAGAWLGLVHIALAHVGVTQVAATRANTDCLTMLVQGAARQLKVLCCSFIESRGSRGSLQLRLCASCLLLQWACQLTAEDAATGPCRCPRESHFGSSTGLPCTCAGCHSGPGALPTADPPHAGPSTPSTSPASILWRHC